MWITYTFFSRALNAEETVTLLMPHPHQVKDGLYTKADLYEKRRKLPVLFAMGDEGTENNWWMRYSFAEGDIHRQIAAVVCMRGMPANEKTIRYVGEELPALLCAQFPFDFADMAFLGWMRSEAFHASLADSPYRLVLASEGKDCSQAMQAALVSLTSKG
jgi:hypothetical protein